VRQAFRNEGKVRSFGVSVGSPTDGLIAVKEFGFKALEVNFNMLDQRALECGLLEICQQQNVGVIARTPLCFGFLTGAVSPGQDFEAGDHRSTWSSEQLDCWANGGNLFFNTISRSPAETNTQTALRYCLSYPGVSTAIPGMLTSKHVEENQAASDLGALGQDEVRLIEEIYQQHSFYVRSK
jgi:aryl-alcohol dehydrogenase-like predicted oxidoreductase